MRPKRGWWNLPTYAGAGVGLFFMLGLLCGCSTTGDRDVMSGTSSELSRIADAVPKIEPKSKYGNPKSYVVFGKRYYTKSSSKGHVERGLASWYGKKFHGRKTSSGERYDMYAMTAAHKTLPLPTYARVTNVSNGRSAVVKINDRGPFHGSRVIDLSYSAARKLGVVASGTAMVEIKTIDPSRPEFEEEDGFLASADTVFRTRSESEAQKEVVVTRKTPAAKKPTAHAEETATQVAKVQESDVQAKEAPIRVVEAKVRSEPEPKVAAVATKGSSMYLQVGAFGSRMNAEQLRRQLVRNIAERVQIRTTGGTTTSWYKVHVGPLDSRESANDLSHRLASLGLEGSHVVVE